jgi:hypothetical protein
LQLKKKLVAVADLSSSQCEILEREAVAANKQASSTAALPCRQKSEAGKFVSYYFSIRDGGTTEQGDLVATARSERPDAIDCYCQQSTALNQQGSSIQEAE